MATRFPTPVSQDFAAFRRAFDPLFAEVFTPIRTRTNEAATALPLDVFAQDDDLIVVAAVPGIEPEALTITVEKNAVTIAGKAAPIPADTATTTTTTTTWFLQELPRGNFSRTLTLPETFEVDAARAEATFDNGLLRLTLPKRESAKARQIRVKVVGTSDAPAVLPAAVEASSTPSTAEPDTSAVATGE